MKLVASLIALASVANANISYMRKIFPVYWNETFQQFSQFKAFDPSLVNQLNLDQIDGYGCWCYFNEDVGRGRSHPIDEVDALCRLLSQGYECAMLDSEAETGVTCTPWTTEYESSGSGIIQGTIDIVDDCLTKNPDDVCKQRSCMVESYFLLNISSLVLLELVILSSI